VGRRRALRLRALSRRQLAEVMAAINRWGMGREMQITEFDRLALSLA
jgi:hypothetical protein